MSATATANLPDLTKLFVWEIAALVRHHWPKVYFGAVPYLDAMGTMHSFDQNYGDDSGREIGLYFLANANGFRGDAARQIKAEIKRRLKA